MLAIRLDSETEARLATLARETGRSKSYYVREAIAVHLEDIEDIYLAEKRLEDLGAGRSQTIPLEQVMAENDL